jgi:hypothetical protein
MPLARSSISDLPDVASRFRHAVRGQPAPFGRRGHLRALNHGQRLAGRLVISIDGYRYMPCGNFQPPGLRELPFASDVNWTTDGCGR